MAPNKNWMIVFTDNEDDMMLVGDDPWQEFCAMVRQIFIYPKEEVQKMDSSTLNPKNEDCPDMKENLKPNLGQEKDPMAGIMDLMKCSVLSSGLVKILKKYDKRTGALIRQPFIEKVLQQPFFTTDLLYKLVKECGYARPPLPQQQPINFSRMRRTKWSAKAGTIRWEGSGVGGD
ncbi:hypothetical protein ZIOFF_068029 [Zingiber officinale]|uniref:Auxin-responsive protein n=1 Tax=Zingiber officinale TaxID=94328 RepID=A0A8J5CCZ3_ZINOF|nr:hypothetical protein ZIOFF_068029 [Zingiber officinale]